MRTGTFDTSIDLESITELLLNEDPRWEAVHLNGVGEVVFQRPVDHCRDCVIRFFSTINKGNGKLRENGTDAFRVVGVKLMHRDDNRLDLDEGYFKPSNMSRANRTTGWRKSLIALIKQVDSGVKKKFNKSVDGPTSMDALKKLKKKLG